MLRILLLEDDHLQAAWIREELEVKIKAHVDHVSTELAFRKHLDEIRKIPPHVAVLDVIVRWKNPEDKEVPPHDDEARSGPSGAGLRCAQLLLKQFPQIPIVLFTVLDKNDMEMEPLGSKTVFLQKHADIDQLIEIIHRVRRQSHDGGV